MRVFTSVGDVQLGCTVVTVGSFDGVHLGHRMLLERLASEARDRNAKPLVVTFDPHPKKVLGTGSGFLTTVEEQLMLMEEAGVENVLMIPFTETFRCMPSECFAKDFLAAGLHAVAVVMGTDHSFGRDASGSADCIAAAGMVPVRVELLDDIGSTAIRDMVRIGELEGASRLLGGKGYLVKTPVADASKILPPDGLYEALVDGMQRDVNVPELPGGKTIRILKQKQILKFRK